MPDYKQMYFQLFAKVADAVELLQQAQRETEESYLLDFPTRLSGEAKADSEQ